MTIARQRMLDRPDGVYEVAAVGFGPAGVALAVAMEDALEGGQDGKPWDALFLEEASDSTWQAEMLMRSTDIQHHFLRDFATPRDPRSRFTFANYLKESDRLFDFGLWGGAPGRIEWSDYCSWVAGQVDQRTLYDHSVQAIEPVVDGAGGVDLFRIRAFDAVRDVAKTFLAENVVLCTGRRPQVPPLFESRLGKGAFHSHHFLTNIAKVPAEPAPTFAVVGSGQNAIEVVLHLIDRYPRSEIFSINRNSGFRLYDLGNFSNQVYAPDDVEYFYWLPEEARQALLDELKFTNYSSVDADVSQALFRRVYEDRVMGQERIHVVKRSAVTDVAPNGDALDLVIEDIYRGERQVVTADVTVLCTGYADEPVPSLLEEISPYLVLNDEGNLRIGRDYDVETVDRVQAGLYVNGLTELTHGISDAASFSMMAIKADRTLSRLRDRRAERPPADLAWTTEAAS